jgi:hypothetical protein
VESGMAVPAHDVRHADPPEVDTQFHHSVLDVVVDRLSVAAREIDGVQSRVGGDLPRRRRGADHARLAAEKSQEAAEWVHRRKVAHPCGDCNQLAGMVLRLRAALPPTTTPPPDRNQHFPLPESGFRAMAPGTHQEAIGWAEAVWARGGSQRLSSASLDAISGRMRRVWAVGGGKRMEALIMAGPLESAQGH